MGSGYAIIRAIRRIGCAVCVQILSELSDFLLQQLVFVFFAPQKMHQQVQFFIESLRGQHIGIGCLVAGILEPGGLDMAFFYQLGQAVMRLSQAEPQITGKIPLGKDEYPKCVSSIVKVDLNFRIILSFTGFFPILSGNRCLT